MEGLVKGDVVVVPFPFSDLTSAKRRPALVVAILPGADAILCQITSQTVRDGMSIALGDTEFESGRLHKPSNIRPNRLFTADRALVLSRVGHIRPKLMLGVVQAIVRIIEA